MEGRKHNLLIVLIAAVIAAAVLSSFGLGLFAPETARIVLPTPAATGGPEDQPGVQEHLVRVEVTPETVQNVIRTLSRPESYRREVLIEDIWGEGEDERGETRVQVWVDGGWTMTRSALPGGRVRWSIVGEDSLWLWYEGEEEALQRPADRDSADIEGQRILTYEDVLALETPSITSTGYVEQGELPCIYVETAPDELGYWQRYWVSVDSGLLVCAEISLGDTALYRMSSYTVERPVPEGTSFSLPDGQVLHTPGTVSPDPTPGSGQG